jgi:hypothetical protein
MMFLVRCSLTVSPLTATRTSPLRCRGPRFDPQRVQRVTPHHVMVNVVVSGGSLTLASATGGVCAADCLD